MFRKSIQFALLLSLSLGGFGQQAKHGFYSRAALPLWEEIAGSPTPIVVASPDRRSRVLARWQGAGCKDKDECVVLDLEGALGKLHLDIGPGVGSEVLWAPDSKAFFVTTSNAGANGDYHLFVVGTFEGKMQGRDITERIYREFGHPFRCGWEESPNVAGIGWVGKTHHLWVAAEVVNHSNCDSFGTFKAYEVDPAAMAVVQTLDQIEAKRELGPLLGKELMLAPDQCVRKPGSCYVSTNHPELLPKQR
ncbi:MAG: hypothetical protein ABR912_09700 [Terracidiphilus sp.]|jgi:hypothetical protein